MEIIIPVIAVIALLAIFLVVALLFRRVVKPTQHNHHT